MSVVVEAPPAGRTDPRPITEIIRPSPKDWEVRAAYQNYGESKPFSPDWGIFNAVKIPAPEISSDTSVIVARAVYIPNIREGEPDRNSLHVCLTDSNGKFQRLPDLTLPVDDRVVNWEDARVGPNERTLGFTVVLREDGKYSPHPALVNVAIVDGHLETVGDPRIFSKLTGKNVIPLESGAFIYRPDAETHKLHFLDFQGELLREIDFSDFRDISWLSKKMGVVARPIELDDGSKLLFIHGVSKDQIGIDGMPKDDVYALGLAILDKDWQVLNVDKEPLLRREDFLSNLDPSMDLNPQKEVVYACHVEKGKNGFVVFTNVGERITVITNVSYYAIDPRIANMRLLRAA